MCLLKFVHIYHFYEVASEGKIKTASLKIAKGFLVNESQNSFKTFKSEN